MIILCYTSPICVDIDMDMDIDMDIDIDIDIDNGTTGIVRRPRSW